MDLRFAAAGEEVAVYVDGCSFGFFGPKIACNYHLAVIGDDRESGRFAASGDLQAGVRLRGDDDVVDVACGLGSIMRPPRRLLGRGSLH